MAVAVAVEANSVGLVPGETELPRERAKKLVCRKTSTGSHIEYKKRELFTRKTIKDSLFIGCCKEG